jgi:hypothetical protein
MRVFISQNDAWFVYHIIKSVVRMPSTCHYHDNMGESVSVSILNSVLSVYINDKENIVSSIGHIAFQYYTCF